MQNSCSAAKNKLEKNPKEKLNFYFITPPWG
jgi:hypothetical protein